VAGSLWGALGGVNREPQRVGAGEGRHGPRTQPPLGIVRASGASTVRPIGVEGAIGHAAGIGRMGQRKGPWTVRDSREVYRNPWIAVRADRVVRPDGEEGEFGVVEMKPGVSVLPVDDDGTAHLVRIYRYTLDRETVEVVAGGIDEGETPQEAARRELREEAGIEAAEWLDLGTLDQLTEVVVSPNRLFLARRLTFAPPRPEGSERIRRVAVPMDEAVRRVMDGEITHAASATLILKAARRLER
jgi:8-oxo-dGTP pyrophosphatase MutT (NUDIX family)